MTLAKSPTFLDRTWSLEVVIVPHGNYPLNNSAWQEQRSDLVLIRVFAPFAAVSSQRTPVRWQARA